MVVSVLLSLLVFCVVLYIVFWLLGIILAGIPGVPPAAKGIIMAIVAILALCYLFGGYAPWWGGQHLRWR
jgi:hypothetical protein